MLLFLAGFELFASFKCLHIRGLEVLCESANFGLPLRELGMQSLYRSLMVVQAL